MPNNEPDPTPVRNYVAGLILSLVFAVVGVIAMFLAFARILGR